MQFSQMTSLNTLRLWISRLPKLQDIGPDLFHSALHNIPDYSNLARLSNTEGTPDSLILYWRIPLRLEKVNSWWYGEVEAIKISVYGMKDKGSFNRWTWVMLQYYVDRRWPLSIRLYWLNRNETYPTAPVPRVISKTVAPPFDRKSASTFFLSESVNDPSMRSKCIPIFSKRRAAMLRVFFHEEKTILYNIRLATVR